MIDEFWKRNDKVVCDGQRIDIIGKRMFADLDIKQGSKITYEQAKKLAFAVLLDFGYREWRSAELDKVSQPATNQSAQTHA